MEFRIAPLIMAVFNLIFITFVNPAINESISLSQVSSLPKILFPFLLIFALSIGAFLRHSYYTKSFKLAYYIIQAINLALGIYYVYTIQQEHLS